MPPAPIPPLVTYSLLATGAWLVYASVRGLSPLGELTATLRGTPSPGPAPLRVGDALAGGTVQDAAPSNPSRAGSLTAAPTNLVSIGQGGHRLAAPTARAFKAWQGAFGSTIVLTDSYRDAASQLAAWQGDPVRFAHPSKSRHVRGEAVDVNLQAIGASPTGNASQKARWTALYDAATATGWCNPRGPYKGDHREPWHFSNPGCG